MPLPPVATRAVRAPFSADPLAFAFDGRNRPASRRGPWSPMALHLPPRPAHLPACHCSARECPCALRTPGNRLARTLRQSKRRPVRLVLRRHRERKRVEEPAARSRNRRHAKKFASKSLADHGLGAMRLTEACRRVMRSREPTIRPARRIRRRLEVAGPRHALQRGRAAPTFCRSRSSTVCSSTSSMRAAMAFLS